MNDQNRSMNRYDENPNHSSHPAPCYTKVPVQIVHSKFEMTIDKTIKISEGTNEILDIHWSSPPPDHQINLIANRLWLSGHLQAEITYTKGNSSSVHLESLLIPWKKTCSLNYTYPPMLPLSNEKTQYDFINQTQADRSSTHFEQTLYQNEEPQFELVSTHIITTKTIEKRESNSYLLLNIFFEKEFRIWQHQITKQ